MTKEERIQEAYGDYYDRIKLHIDENGWVDTQAFSCSKKGIEFEQYKKRFNTYLGFYNRPKSLEGIEDNNGWIKIESEEDLPKTGTYDMSAYKLIYWTNGGQFGANDFNRWVLNYPHLEITHYQFIQIIKLNKPLY